MPKMQFLCFLWLPEPQLSSITIKTGTEVENYHAPGKSTRQILLWSLLLSLLVHVKKSQKLAEINGLKWTGLAQLITVKKKKELDIRKVKEKQELPGRVLFNIELYLQGVK